MWSDMKLALLLMGLGLIVNTRAYGIDPEDSGVLNPAAEPSAPTRQRRPHTGALPSHIPTPSTTTRANITVVTAAPVAAVPERHDQQFGTSETDAQVVQPAYSQSSYEIRLQPLAVEHRHDQSSSSYGSAPVVAPAPPTAGYQTPPPSLPSYSAPHTSLPSYSTPHTSPPSPSSQHQVTDHHSSYDNPNTPAVPLHGHQTTVFRHVSLPVYHTSWSAPSQTFSSHASSSSSYGQQQQQHTEYNDGQSSNKDTNTDDSGENRDQHSGGAFSISFTAPAFPPVPLSPVIAYQLPQTTVHPVYQTPPRQQYEQPRVPQYEPPRSAGFPQYQPARAPAQQPHYPPPIPPATLPQYEPVRNPSHVQSATPSYQVIAVAAEPANVAYPAPAAPSYIEEVYPDDLSAIPGTPGQDYPQMAKVPQTTFNCGDKLPGYYADLDSQCQVWHFCDMSGRRESFLCPNGTLYNQEKFVCDWWYNVDCGLATSFFRLNEELYKVPVKTPVAQYQPAVQQQQQQGQHRQQGNYQQQQQQEQQQHGHHQQHQGHYNAQHQGHFHQQQQTHQRVNTGYDSGSSYGRESSQSSSFSVTQEHPAYVSQTSHAVVTKQPHVSQPTPSYSFRSSTVATPVRTVENSEGSAAPVYGQPIPKEQLELNESHEHSTY